MPIATPPPDFDPSLVPPSHTQPTEAEARETGVAGAGTEKVELSATDKARTDLLKLWPEGRAESSSVLAQPEVHDEGAP
jgi:hypothetical protein